MSKGLTEATGVEEPGQVGGQKKKKKVKIPAILLDWTAELTYCTGTVVHHILSEPSVLKKLRGFYPQTHNFQLFFLLPLLD